MSKDNQTLEYNNRVFAWLQHPNDQVPEIAQWHADDLQDQYGIGDFEYAATRVNEFEADRILALQLRLAGFGGDILSMLVSEQDSDSSHRTLKTFGLTAVSGNEDEAITQQTTRSRVAGQPPISSTTGYSYSSNIPSISPHNLLRPLSWTHARNVFEKDEFIRRIQDRDPNAPWQKYGLCAQTDPEAFFPEKGGSTKEGKKICLSCEVRDECLQEALDTGERYGIWGGLSERERRKLGRTGVNGTADDDEGDYVEASREYRMYEPRPEHGRRIDQFMRLCDISDKHADALEFDDEVRAQFISKLVRALHYAVATEDKNVEHRVNIITDYFTTDDITNIWQHFAKDRDYWADMTTYLKEFHDLVSQMQTEQMQLGTAWTETLKSHMISALDDEPLKAVV